MDNKYLLNIKKKYNEVMLGTNSIAKLMTEKVSELQIIKELPMSFNLNGFTVYVGNFNFENERKFFSQWAAIFGALIARVNNMEVTTDRKNDLIKKADFHLLAKGEWLYEFMLIDDWLYKKIAMLLTDTLIKQQQFIAPNRKKGEDKKKFVKWRNATWKWWSRNCDSETLIQICASIYLYNFDSVKKNVKILAGSLGILEETEQYMYFWLQNWAGLTGKFLNAQAVSLDYAFRDKVKEERQQKDQKDFEVVGAK